jgi:hypothetical protein
MSKTLRNSVLWIGVVVSVLWLVKYFSETEMRRLDKEVDRLCAIDGGMRIFETVSLPANKFNEYGRPLVPGGKDDTGFGYFVRGETKTLSGPGQAPGARLVRDLTQVVRTDDAKVIAERVIYVRGGGYWLEGVPGIGRGKNCPDPEPLDLRARVFIKE